ncbi:MAG: YtxH domain-containing protein [Armatimonadetes bacterium]|nr:YtxH domain-containing protein [Armatimonadota bacterium]
MRSGDFMAGILVGVLIGGALGLLFAPEPGEETRELVAEKARKWKDVAGEKGRTILRRVKEEAEETAE